MSSTTDESNRPLHIVVGCDFSPLSELALREAATIASDREGSQIHVLHVLDGTDRLSHTGQADIVSETIDHLRSEIERAFTGVDARDDIGVFTHVLYGDPADEVLGLAEDVAAHLLVVGTHGKKGLRRLLLGSVAEKIMRYADCPVLVMRPRRYEAHPEWQPEPPCEACVTTRQKTGGAQWWCDVHDKPWTPPTRYTYKNGGLNQYHAGGSGSLW